jgi:hypothetical protein
MYATLKKRVHSTAVLCLLVLVIPAACTKKSTGADKQALSLSPEEVNKLTVDNGIGDVSYGSQVARASTAIQVEAENYSAMYGIEVEACREGGQDVGYISPGDWMDYIVDIPASGNYDIDFRVAGPGGILQVQLPNNQVLATVNLPVTAGGQIYQTTRAPVVLNAGTQTLRIYAVTGYWNFNWFKIISQEEVILDSISNAPYANLLLTSTFEDGSDLKQWSQEVCRWDAIQISNDVARKGQAAAKFELTKDDVLNFDGFTRAELRRTSETDGERWYGFSNFLPAGFVADPLAEMIAQWHDVPDFVLGESWRSPPISLEVINDHYYVHTLWSASVINTDLTRDGEKIFDLGPVDKSQWNDWVFHIRFSYRPDGIIEVWKNKVKVLTYNGPNSYNDRSYPYFKIGIYKWGWNGWASYSPENKRTLYYDEVRVGNSNSGFDEVATN